jgi:hypothetical protein
MNPKCLERGYESNGDYQYKSAKEKAFVHSAEARKVFSEGLTHGLNGSPKSFNPYKGIKEVIWNKGYRSGCSERDEY